MEDSGSQSRYFRRASLESGVHLPAQRLSAGQENGLHTCWLIQPGAPERVLGREEKTLIVLFAE
jgi:hypothetical protein